MSAAALARAMGYPYYLPKQSYVVLGERVMKAARDGDLPGLAGRTPVLAVGSNQSPEQIIRKFGDEDWGPIPVTRIQLFDFDTVFSPHITAYGSIPATLQVSPGAIVTLFVTWLDERQLLRMHETEISMGNYHYATLHGVRMKAELGRTLTDLNVYLSKHGALRDGGGVVPLAEVPALNRRRPARNQEEIQIWVRDKLSPDAVLEDYILEAVNNRPTRLARTEKLRACRLPFGYDNVTILENP